MHKFYQYLINLFFSDNVNIYRTCDYSSVNKTREVNYLVAVTISSHFLYRHDLVHPRSGKGHQFSSFQPLVVFPAFGRWPNLQPRRRNQFINKINLSRFYANLTLCLCKRVAMTQVFICLPD